MRWRTDLSGQHSKLDEYRRRVRNETLGHRGHKPDPLYRCRRLLTEAVERLDEKGREKLLGLLKPAIPTAISVGRGAKEGCLQEQQGALESGVGIRQSLQCLVEHLVPRAT